MKKPVEGSNRIRHRFIGKNTFHVVGLDSLGQASVAQQVLDVIDCQFTSANTPAALIGMESCPGSQWLARKLQASGHTVKIIPAQSVKLSLRQVQQETTWSDAAAIAEAVTRPTMRFVQIRQPEQSARQSCTTPACAIDT